MNLYKKLLLASAVALCSSAAWAQTDVTATYLVNPSFEGDASACTDAVKVENSSDGLRGWKVKPTGWTITETGTDLLISADCFTDNNFGKTAIEDGTYAFYQRVGWTSLTSALSQTTEEALAAGDYELSFISKAFCANGAASSANYAVKDADGKTLAENSFSCVAGSASIMGSSKWDERTLKFHLDAPTKITISLLMSWQSGGSQMAFDNFKLTLLPEGTIDPDAPNVEGGTEDEVTSPTEGVISGDFVSEADMQADLLKMLATFTTYCSNIYTTAANNSAGEATGYFKANSAGQNNEDGVRTNADLSMICAFVYKYGKANGVALPSGITYDKLKDMALKSLIYGYSTHKANKMLKTTNSAYWGSVSNSDHVWESSLWAMSIAYSSFFLADELTDTQKDYIYKLIKAECNYELERSIPTGYNGDTKAEENGWEADILACALGLYPNDPLAEKWFDRLRAFAINSYSQEDDKNDNTVIDPDYDKKTVADYFIGACLYPDYTLQNHNYFHTSYQNVVMQELGEAHLAMALFQGADAKWKTNALMHNNQKVMDNVLKYLALSDGELAMPNGNDWSMFLFDQITSYSTAACFLSDANALMLENLAYKNIKARQTTTTDGSWLLNSDIGPRRMGVEAHRVMMTYLMHEMASTASLTPTAWDDFQKDTQDAMIFRTQNIVRASTPARYSIFSWSAGLGNYTGYFVPNNPDYAKIVVPYKANKTGNLLGWYTVDGKSTDASPAVSGIYELNGTAWAMNGKLNTNGGALENNFAIYSTPGNALIYVDYVVGKSAGKITKEYGGLLAISVDPFLKEKRTLYYDNGRLQSDGSEFKTFASPWVNIDNAIGVAVADNGNKMAFGEKGLSNSISVAKLVTSYDGDSRSYAAGDVVDKRGIVYYSSVNADDTKALSSSLISLSDKLAEGWNGVIAADPDSSRYLLLSNFVGNPSCTLTDVMLDNGAPVFPVATTISATGSTATFLCDLNHSIASPINVYLQGADIVASLDPENANAVILSSANGAAAAAAITIFDNGTKVTKENVSVPATGAVKAYVQNGEIVVEETEITPGDSESYVDITEKALENPSFELDKTWATVGAITLNNVNYDPCYVQDVKPASSDYPQVLPVEGWTPGNELQGASNFCLLYSMPYSASMYCVSPSNLGNSASIMAAPALFPEAGTRCLSVLNSWTKGNNAITQSVKLPAGKYKLKFVAQYVCANESGRPDDATITTASNENHSLCGISYGDTKTYIFPAQANTWEQISLPFELAEPTKVTVSMGLNTTASVGAANITRLYLDDVRLYSETDVEIEEEKEDGILGISNDNGPATIYNLQGLPVSHPTPGIYIINGKKVRL